MAISAAFSICSLVPPRAAASPALAIAAADPSELDDFFSVKYQGARYSIGYPACPDLADRAKIARLLQPERIGVELSEEMQLHPEQSTDAIVVHHPAARYFSV